MGDDLANLVVVQALVAQGVHIDPIDLAAFLDRLQHKAQHVCRTLQGRGGGHTCRLPGAPAHWRLTLAQAHLRAGRSLKSIAHELGYANPSALSRVFAQKLGMSARDWREAVDAGR